MFPHKANHPKDRDWEQNPNIGLKSFRMIKIEKPIMLSWGFWILINDMAHTIQNMPLNNLPWQLKCWYHAHRHFRQRNVHFKSDPKNVTRFKKPWQIRKYYKEQTYFCEGTGKKYTPCYNHCEITVKFVS